MSRPEILAATLDGSRDSLTLAQLHSRLLERAGAEGLIDLAYREMDSPIGRLLLVASPQGLVRIAFAVQGFDPVLSRLAEQISPRVLHSPQDLDTAARQIDEYFAGHRKSFDLALDLSLARGFRRNVIERLADIAFGATASYSDVAAAAGSPRAVRAAGSACATNPLPLVLPCHRVLRSDGSLGGYAGGLEIKRMLLEMEAGR